jgi:hypothetical protein
VPIKYILFFLVFILFFLLYYAFKIVNPSI